MCDFRLDFESFNIHGPAVTLETDNAHQCQDIFLATVNTGSATSVNTVGTTQKWNSLPEICGENQGQHCK